MTLQHLTEDRFAMAYLHDKPANITADLSSRAMKDTGRFMILTGGDQMSAAKKRGHIFTFKPMTKLIFSCNVIPSTPNKALAFYRRWIIIRFPNVIPEDQVDENLKDKLTTEKELSGVLSWALVGLKRLLKKHKFSYPLTEEDVKDLYERGSDSISSYIYQEIDKCKRIWN